MHGDAQLSWREINLSTIVYKGNNMLIYVTAIFNGRNMMAILTKRTILPRMIFGATA